MSGVGQSLARNVMHSFPSSRRRFIKTGLAAVAGLAATPAFAAMPRLNGARSLALHNLHTDERTRVTYWKDGAYDRGAWGKLNHIMRDHYSGDVCPMHAHLFDLLHDLQGKLHNDGVIEIVSAYRSPKTNLMLASYSDGVAKRSYHTKGMAIDIRMPGSSLPKIHKTALAMKRGGVGYYPDSEFVHMDVGPIRTW